MFELDEKTVSKCKTLIALFRDLEGAYSINRLEESKSNTLELVKQQKGEKSFVVVNDKDGKNVILNSSSSEIVVLINKTIAELIRGDDGEYVCLDVMEKIARVELDMKFNNPRYSSIELILIYVPMVDRSGNDFSTNVLVVVESPLGRWNLVI